MISSAIQELLTHTLKSLEKHLEIKANSSTQLSMPDMFLRRIYMKKFISAVAAISICALMLTACGNNGTTDEGSTESVTAEASADVTEDTSSADTEQDKSEDDTSHDEDENVSVIDNEDNDTDSGDMLSYDSFDDIDVSEI